jgi:hypothetical protein
MYRPGHSNTQPPACSVLTRSARTRTPPHTHTQIWPYNAREIKGGEVIGCGVDWECGQEFFVRNPTHEEPNTTDVFVCRFPLDRKETYPAVGTAPPQP